MKYALLELLSAEPMHGYQMMKALEERSEGQYTPSAGSIYPTLQMLEDRGWIEADEPDGKKVYRPTDAGMEALKEWSDKERKERPAEAGDCSVSPRERLLADGFELLRLLTKAERRAAVDPGYAGRMQRFLDEALSDLRSLLADPRAGHRNDNSREERDERDRPAEGPAIANEERDS
ncbi:MAG: PadR family transcriptional regulator [Paenibacillus sp.]|nr:PadR family transcriptional regulator [Paenibacillus sp.]